MYKVSIIMPVYNNEDTLRPTIESILNQTVTDFELILIDDGSTDSSAKICMDYAKKEPLLVEVIHQKKLGFTKTRNKGLNQVRASYVYFADAGNVLHPRMLESNIKLLEEQNAELVVFGFSQKNEKNQEIIKHIPKIPFLLSKERFRKDFRNFYYFSPYKLCNKLFEVKYLRNQKIEFNNDLSDDKCFFNLDIYKNLNKVVFNRKLLCQKNCLNDDDLLKDQEELFNITLDSINHLKKMLIYWDMVEEYRDLIMKEHYYLLELKISNLLNSNLNLSNKQLVKKIDRILKDDQVYFYLNHETTFVSKNMYEKVLWNSFQNGNNRVTIKILRSKNQTDKVIRNIKKNFKKWFN